jgi:hypothetical protein
MLYWLFVCLSHAAGVQNGTSGVCLLITMLVQCSGCNELSLIVDNKTSYASAIYYFIEKQRINHLTDIDIT